DGMVLPAARAAAERVGRPGRVRPAVGEQRLHEPQERLPVGHSLEGIVNARHHRPGLISGTVDGLPHRLRAAHFPAPNRRASFSTYSRKSGDSPAAASTARRAHPFALALSPLRKWASARYSRLGACSPPSMRTRASAARTATARNSLLSL